MTTYENAVNEIFSLFNTKWQANTTAIVGYIPTVFWQGVKEPNLPDSSKYWARISTRMVLEQQSSISACVGPEGMKKYESVGIVTVQLFCPQSDIQVGARGRKLAQMVKNIFRRRSTNVWFLDSTLQELSPEPSWFRFNITAELHFEEVY